MFGQSFIDQKARSSQGKSIRGDLSKQPIIGAFVQIYFLIVGAGAIPVRFYLRENYGERSITVSALAISLSLHIWYVYAYVNDFQFLGFFTYQLFNGQELHLSNEMGLVKFFIYIFLFFNAFSYYLFDVFFIKGRNHITYLIGKSDEKPIREYSYYRGDGKYFSSFVGKRFKTPFKTFIINERLRRILVEPCLSFAIGLLLFSISFVITLFLGLIPTFLMILVTMLTISVAAVGVLIMLSSVCLFLEEIGIESKKRNAVLDIFDGEKELEELNLKISTAKSTLPPLRKGIETRSTKSYPLVKISNN